MTFNTPFKMWKRYEFNGGTSDPCIISWPAGTKARGEVREQYYHAIDLVPTILDALGVSAPESVKGHYPGAAPYRFTGGTIDRVAVDVGGEPYVDLEREAETLLRNQ